MIIPSHKLLFVHIPKTGGQSIIEFILRNITTKIDLNDNIKYGLKLNTDHKLPGPSHYHHLFLREYMDNKILPTEDIENYYKFTVLRNPYDRFISAFSFQCLHEHYNTTYDFVKDFQKLKNKDERLYRMFCSQTQYVTLKDSINFINMYYTVEDMQDIFLWLRKDFKFIGKELHNNKSNKVYDLDDKTLKFIEDYYACDFELIEEVKWKRK